jgi:ABC-type enterochelin transport system substrate-binding protein
VESLNIPTSRHWPFILSRAAKNRQDVAALFYFVREYSAQSSSTAVALALTNATATTATTTTTTTTAAAAAAEVLVKEEEHQGVVNEPPKQMTLLSDPATNATVTKMNSSLIR